MMSADRAVAARLGRAQILRAHALAQLRDADPWNLALIVAGAGFGKSILLDQYAATSRRVVRCDLQPPAVGLVDLLRYLARQLAPLDPPGATALAAALPAGQLTGGSAQSTRVIAAARDVLEQVVARRPLVLVIDDYHWTAEDPEVQRLIVTLLRPPLDGLRVILATRTEPQLPVARLRALGQVVELGAGALTFTPAEAAELLQVDDLSAEARTHVYEVTEGWPAGLRLIRAYLAGLPVEERERAALEIQGDTGAVYDYLREEVLAAQPASRQRFLLESSLLPSLTAADGDAILSRRDSGAQLRYLRERGLFLVPLVERPGRYRYHHLFGAFLRDQALRRLTAPHRQRVYLRAAAHYMEHGRTVDALDMLAQGERWAELATALVARHGTLLEMGEVGTLRRWLDALPPGVLEAQPGVLLCAGRLRYAVGDLPGATAAFRGVAVLDQHNGAGDFARQALVELGHVLEQQGHYKEAEEAYLASSATDADGTPYAPAVAGLAALAQYDGRWRDALDLHERALRQALSGEEPARQASVMHNLAWCYHDWGKFELACSWYERSVRLKEGHHLTQGLAITLNNMGLLALQTGDLRAARGHLDRAAALASRLLQQHRLSYVLANLGELEELEGDLEAADSLYRRSLAMKERAGDSYGAAYTLTQRARLSARRTDPAAGQRLLAEARMLRGAAARPREQASFEQTEALLAMALGDLTRARACLERAVTLYAALGTSYALVAAHWILAHVLQRAGLPYGDSLAQAQRIGESEGYAGLLTRLQAQFPVEAEGAPTPRGERAASDLQVALLGGFTVQVGTRVIPQNRWKRRRSRALLAALALSWPQEVERDELVEMLWPEVAPDTVEALFYAHLRALRVALEPTLQRGNASIYVQGNGTRYALVLREPWDGALLLTEHRAGQRAASLNDDEEARRHWQAVRLLYRGPLLPEQSFADEAWLVGPREGMRRAALEALANLATSHERRGAVADAIDAWRDLLDIDSCFEQAHGGLIRLLAQAGRQEEARAQYERCVTSLRRDLDTAPSRWLEEQARALWGR